VSEQTLRGRGRSAAAARGGEGGEGESQWATRRGVYRAAHGEAEGCLGIRAELEARGGQEEEGPGPGGRRR
jgi:hypothetical protein